MTSPAPHEGGVREGVTVNEGNPDEGDGRGAGDGSILLQALPGVSELKMLTAWSLRSASSGLNPPTSPKVSVL